VEELGNGLDALAVDTHFSGAVRIETRGDVLLERGYGLANRAYGIPNTVETQYGTASATKGFTALAVATLLEEGALELSTPVRTLLGDDLPLVDDNVTVEHLLAHRSGMGDYLDEGDDLDVTAYVLPVPAHELSTTEQYLRVLDGHAQKFPPGEQFAYSNAGYVVLALVAERAVGIPFHDLIVDRVCRPAGMTSTAFLRSDELPGTAAIGYLDLDSPKTNVFHLPIRGGGDGGIYSTVGDVSSFWRAFLDGRIVEEQWVAELLRSRSDVTRRSGARYRYGLGFWLRESTDAALLDGYDAGVSFRSVHAPDRELVYTVVSNTSEGAFPVARWLQARLET
jgi:CubicO group peptidase (beta-lactamase class C family)